MSTLPPRRPLALDDGVLNDLKRLRRRMMRLQMEHGKGSDLKQILALVEELTAVTDALVEQAENIRHQITALQQGLTAATAYRHTKNLASGCMTGDRK
jgi:hypothetical protein